jgi:hypothetical protein
VIRETFGVTSPGPVGYLLNDSVSLNAVVCSRLHEPQDARSAGTITLEISSRNARVAALQKRWDRLRAGLDLILDQRGANMADLPSGASGMWCATTRARGPTGW